MNVRNQFSILLARNHQRVAARLLLSSPQDEGQQSTLSKIYMLDRQLARKAGKGKTRHVRFALPFHNLMQKVAGDSSCGQSKP